MDQDIDAFTRYIEEEIGSVIQVALDTSIGDNEYEEHRVDGWIHDVLQQCTGHLSEYHKNYKFVATCLLAPNTGMGTSGHSSCFWDPSTDRTHTFVWQSVAVRCTVTIYSVCAVQIS